MANRQSEHAAFRVKPLSIVLSGVVLGELGV